MVWLTSINITERTNYYLNIELIISLFKIISYNEIVLVSYGSQIKDSNLNWTLNGAFSVLLYCRATPRVTYTSILYDLYVKYLSL